jgi:uncharacterized phage protein gp47/JayE
VADLASLEQRIAVARRAVASIPEAKLDPAAIEKAGSTLNILFAGSAAMNEEVERRAMAKLAALTLAGARGVELDALAAERTYGIVARFGASPAVVPVRLRRASGGPLAAGKLEAKTLFLAGAVQFSLDVEVPFASGQLGPIETTATATTAGSATEVAVGAISGFVEPGKVFDPRIEPTNPEPAAGGADAELDDSLRGRIRAFPRAIQRGTLAAIEFGALLVPGVTKAIAVEAIDLAGIQTGLILLYVADTSGQANSALVNKVRVALRDWRAGGVAVRVLGAIPTFVDVVLAIGYLDGFATASVQNQARAVVVDAVNRLAPNEPLLRSSIVAALKTVPGVVVFDSSVKTPIGDLYPTLGQVFRTTPAQVTFA